MARTNSNQWRRHAYYVTDACFGNRLNGGADFRIAKYGGGVFYLDECAGPDQAKRRSSTTTHP